MYEYMTTSFQDEKRFRYFLDAFLCLARSVPYVLKKELKHNKPLADWYEQKAKEFDSSKIPKLIKEMRDISVHQHTPPLLTTASVSFSMDAIIADSQETKRTAREGDTENVQTTAPKEKSGWTAPKIVNYSFDEPPKWFHERPDVMSVCRKYLDEVEKLVAEAENMAERRKVSSHE
jgi:hypothetical protein